MMNVASFSDFLQIVLVILLIYFGLKVFFRLFGPAIMRFVFRKIGQKVENKFREQQGFPKETQKEGKTTIEKKPPSSRKAKKNAGEYIDYEEID